MCKCRIRLLLPLKIKMWNIEGDALVKYGLGRYSVHLTNLKCATI